MATASASSARGAVAAPRPMTGEEKKVIFASSLGTVFEWYDFYLYGSLAAIIAKQFFSGLDAGAAFIFALLAFAAGFIVRPFGALVFGRLGDMIGRKYTFLVTILIMGLSTFIVGILPNYATIGWAAPVILIGLRMLQGLALGGEYGGAATYVAEHAPQGKRGAYTSWIQTTATLGLFLSLMVILGTRTIVGEEAFADWGWRVPFIVSIALLAVSVWIRLSMNESPAFKKMKEEGKTSKAPLTESFGQWKNLKIVILALIGLTAGQAVVWYTGQFYALFFLTQALQGRWRHRQHPGRHFVADRHAVLPGVRLAVGQDRPQADHHGRLPDRRAVVFPAVQGLTAAANPDLAKAQSSKCPSRWWSIRPSDSLQGSSIPVEVQDQVHQLLRHRQARAGCRAGVNYSKTLPAHRRAPMARIKLGGDRCPSLTRILSFDGALVRCGQKASRSPRFKNSAGGASSIKAAGYPAKADMSAKLNNPMVVGDPAPDPGDLRDHGLRPDRRDGWSRLFPTRIRYTSMSAAVSHRQRLVRWPPARPPPSPSWRQTGNIYNGLWYPIVIAGATFVIGMLFVRETKDVDIYADD